MTLGHIAFQPLAAVRPPLTPWIAQVAARGPAESGPPLLQALVSPTLILLMCIVAGLGTYLLLPGRRPGGKAARGVGGGLLLLAGLVLVLALVRVAALYGGNVNVYFWVFSAIAIFGALRVVTHARPVYAALYFVLTVFATAGLFILLWAEFMAAALVLIYAGAILVTYVFVIMLAASTTQGGVEKVSECDATSRDPLVASAVGFALMGVMLFVIFDRAQPIVPGPRTFTFTATRHQPDGRQVEMSDEINAPSMVAARESARDDMHLEDVSDPEPAFSIQALGRYLFRAQAVNLELAGLILTLGMVGAILIARRQVHLPQDAVATRTPSTFTAPATPISDDPYSIPVYGTDNPAQKAYPET